MKILSIDTSSNICSVAILENTELIKEINIDSGLTHSESLMPAIHKILQDTNLNLTQIGLLVSDKGPGSFTGIRIGTSTIMAFADSLSIPSVGINSLEALAHNVQDEGIICSLIDAKNSNCYCGIYELNHRNYNLLEPLCAEYIDIILETLHTYSQPIIFVGTGALANQDKIKSIYPNCVFVKCNNLSAYQLGLAGLQAYSTGNFENTMPLYLRKSQAERMFKKNDTN